MWLPWRVPRLHMAWDQVTPELGYFSAFKSFNCDMKIVTPCYISYNSLFLFVVAEWSGNKTNKALPCLRVPNGIVKTEQGSWLNTKLASYSYSYTVYYYVLYWLFVSMTTCVEKHLLYINWEIKIINGSYVLCFISMVFVAHLHTFIIEGWE